MGRMRYRVAHTQTSGQEETDDQDTGRTVADAEE